MTIRLPIAPPTAPASAPADMPAQLMQVGDLAKETGKTVRALHLYEELELLRPQGRSKGGFRLYGQDSVRRIRWIGRLQELGFSLSDIQTLAKDFESATVAPAAMARVRNQYADKLAAAREQIERLHQLERELEASLAFLDACDTVCEPETVTRACTSCDHHDCHDPMPELVAGLHAS
jgi:MerR family copper efflux transcriptional regulator